MRKLLLSIQLLLVIFGSSMSGALNEMPVLQLDHLDPSMISICESPITTNDVYTAIGAVLVRAEDEMRRANCHNVDEMSNTSRMVKSLVSGAHGLSVFGENLSTDPAGSIFIGQVKPQAERLFESASKCRVNWNALMFVMDAALKHLNNLAVCQQMRIDMLLHRGGIIDDISDQNAHLANGSSSATMMGQGYSAKSNGTDVSINRHFRLDPYYRNGRIPFARRTEQS